MENVVTMTSHTKFSRRVVEVTEEVAFYGLLGSIDSQLLKTKTDLRRMNCSRTTGEGQL